MTGMQKLILLSFVFTVLLHSSVCDNENESENSKSKKEEDVKFTVVDSNSPPMKVDERLLDVVEMINKEQKKAEELEKLKSELYVKEEMERQKSFREANMLMLRMKNDKIEDRHIEIQNGVKMLAQLREANGKKLNEENDEVDDPYVLYEHLKQQLPQENKGYLESTESKGWKEKDTLLKSRETMKLLTDLDPELAALFKKLDKEQSTTRQERKQAVLSALIDQLKTHSITDNSFSIVEELKEKVDRSFVSEDKERMTNDPHVLNGLIKQQAQSDGVFQSVEQKNLQGDKKIEEELREVLGLGKIVVEEPMAELTEEQKIGQENYEKAQTLLSDRKPDFTAAYNLLEIASTLGNVKAKIHIAWSKLFGTHLAQNIPEAVVKFKEMAAEHIPDAQLALGFLHASGIGVRADQAKALVYYMFAALSGNTWARMALGYRYFAGATVQNSCEKALDFYRLVANEVAKDVSLSGGPMVQRIRLLEEAENSGYNTGIIENDLVEYYQLLAEKGDVKAQVGLGQLHYQGGRGVPLDVQKALQYFIPAADAGNPIAMAFLGKIYLEGYGNSIKQDNQTAYKYFKKAADLNNPVGQAGLGLMYLEGRGVEKDYGKAHRYFSQAADQGWVDGQLQLGVMYFNGLGTRRDYKLANKYFSHASQSGHVLAFYNLAQMHATGTGVMRSCSTAVELYKNVAERGKWGEKLMIAHSMYRDGYINEAFVIYAFMAELGYEVAQSNAAFLLDKQEVTLWKDEKNIFVRALMYWGRAAGQGYSAAIVKLGDYHYYGLGTSIDYEVAAMHYRLASDQQHNAQAMFNLGYMHEQGLGMTKDIYLAKRCYDMAAETSTDAKIPVALALAKLSILFSLKYFEDVKWFNWLFLFDLHHILGPYWDLYLGTFLVGLLGIIFYYRRFLPH